MCIQRYRGFGLIDLMVVVALTTVLVLLALGWSESHRIYSNKVACAANLHGMYQSMYTYGVSNRNKFPIWGNAPHDDKGRVTGFGFQKRDSDKYKPDTKGLTNSATASLWMMVRDGSAQAKQFVCPASYDFADKLLDAQKKPVNLTHTFDFFEPENLSYSMLNMYGSVQRRQWGANVRADRVIMGDNNDANGDGQGNLHKTTKASDAKLLAPAVMGKNETSSNHTGLTWTLSVKPQGQNFLFGDGHASFSADPFQGTAGDNVYAADIQAKVNDVEKAGRPILEIIQGPDAKKAWANFRRDSMLLPLNGNGGKDSLSGLVVKKNRTKKKKPEAKK